MGEGALILSKVPREGSSEGVHEKERVRRPMVNEGHSGQRQRGWERPRGQVHLVDLDSAGAGTVEHKRGAEPRRDEGRAGRIQRPWLRPAFTLSDA